MRGGGTCYGNTHAARRWRGSGSACTAGVPRGAGKRRAAAGHAMATRTPRSGGRRRRRPYSGRCGELGVGPDGITPFEMHIASRRPRPAAAGSDLNENVELTLVRYEYG